MALGFGAGVNSACLQHSTHFSQHLTVKEVKWVELTAAIVEGARADKTHILGPLWCE